MPARGLAAAVLRFIGSGTGMGGGGYSSGDRLAKAWVVAENQLCVSCRQCWESCCNFDRDDHFSRLATRVSIVSLVIMARVLDLVWGLLGWWATTVSVCLMVLAATFPCYISLCELRKGTVRDKSCVFNQTAVMADAED